MFYFNAGIVATALSISMVSTTVQANQSCDVKLSAGININSNKTEFVQEANKNNAKARSLYQINNGKTLLIANQGIALTKAQQNIVTQYDKDIRQLVPQVKKVAIDGIDSAIEGVNLAFNDLLGKGNKLSKDLSKELIRVRTQVETNLSIEKGISIGTDGLEGKGLLGKDFEQRIKTAVQNAVLNSMGSIAMAVGQRMMFDNGQGLSFEEQVKKFTDNIEQEITVRTAKIEQESNKLCVKIIKIDSLEWQLKTKIKPLANINVFTITKNVTRDVTQDVKNSVTKTVTQATEKFTQQGMTK